MASLEWQQNNRKKSSKEDTFSIDKVHPDLSKWLLQEIDLGDGQVYCFTELNRKGTVFRAHPNYRGKGPWYDWVWIPFKMNDRNGDNETMYPCKSLCFVGEVRDQKCMQYVVFNSVDRRRKLSELSFLWDYHQSKNGTKIFHYQTVDCLDHHCLVLEQQTTILQIVLGDEWGEKIK